MTAPLVTVVTANYGDIDSPQEQPDQDIPCRWVCVTRVPKESDTWEIVVEPRPHLSDRQAAKIPKLRTDRYADTEIVVWLDGSVVLKSPSSIRHIIGFLDDSDLAIPPHPYWQTIERESRVAQTQNRHEGQMLEEQYQHYIADCDGESPAVWATAVIARRVTPETKAFGDAALLETLRWSVHDQLCVPYVVHKLGINVTPIDLEGSIYWGNPYVHLRVLNRPEDKE